MAYKFKLNPESLKREYAVYVVIVKDKNNIKLYVGKTGDNREGCNPVISRCGNHFSYNNIHSQVRNKIVNHEDNEYTYIFDHFGKYSKNNRNDLIAKINEMERWLNKEIQSIANKIDKCIIVNPYVGTGYVKKSEQDRRKSFHTPENAKKIKNIINAVKKQIE
jgi:hypothetical protein